MNATTYTRTSRSAASAARRYAALAATALTLVVVSCGPLSDARQSMRRGQPVEAVRLYQQAAAEDPEDPTIAAELSEARQVAGDVLAEEARSALEAGNHAEAVKLATQAAQNNRAHRGLEQRARHVRARALLSRAEDALADGNYQRGRDLAGKAADVAHDLSEPDALVARIDAAHAEHYRQQIPGLLDAGMFDEAMRLGRRAAALQPGDASYAALQSEVDVRRRQAEFDALAVEARQLVAEGTLSSFWPMHAELAALDVREEELAELQSLFEAREQRFLDALNAAKAAHDAGEFEKAIRQYDLAQSIATDRDDLDAQRAAAANLLKAERLRNAGRAALDQSQFHDAVEKLRESVQLHAVADTEGLLRDAEERYYRQQYRDALDHDDRAMAIDNLEKLLRFQQDEELSQLLTRLKSELAESSLHEASVLHGKGDTETALHVLRRAMERVNDPRLDELHAELKAERLLQRAVASDKSGRFAAARDLYLDALAAGGDRAALEARIEDARELADMQAAMRAAQQHADDLGAALNSARHTIQARESDIRRLEDQIRDCENEIDRLVSALRRAEYDLSHARSRNHALESKVYSLECEIDRLRDRLRHARRKPHHDHD